MHKYLVALFTFVILPNLVLCQIHPIEAGRLHYRLVGFSFPVITGASKYVVEISDGNYSTETDFKAHLIRVYTSKTNRVVGEVPAFNRAYTWRVTSKSTNTVATKSDLHHFSTLPLPVFANNEPFRFRIIKPAEKYTDAYVFTDNNRFLYNMKGEPIWFLPPKPGKFNEKASVRNLRISHRGTVTFTCFNLAFEVNYDGDILWEAPNDGKVSGNSSEGYHHQLTILSNDNYMVLGNEPVQWDVRRNASGDSSVHLLSDEEIARDTNQQHYSKTQFGTVIEYDTNNNVVWSWKSSDYYRREYQLKPVTGKTLPETHENAFYFDEKNKYLYVSFKNTSQVLKIRYPSGEVVNVYGNNPVSARVPEENPLFCNQHSCKVTQKGDVYLFNNNICGDTGTPAVVILKQPDQGKGNLKKIWEFHHPYDPDIVAKAKTITTAGGNVIELPGSEMFVSMCVPYGNVFIVNMDKKILWDAVLERWNISQNKWLRESSYRSSIINCRKDMEHLIWSEPLPD